MVRVITQASAIYLVRLVAVTTIGLVWLGNCILIGESMVWPGRTLIGCSVGIYNIRALVWIHYISIAIVPAAIFAVVAAFLSATITNGRHAIYWSLVFVSPLLGLVAQNVSPQIGVIGHIGGTLLLAAPFAGIFLTMFYLYRRLTSRWSGPALERGGLC